MIGIIYEPVLGDHIDITLDLTDPKPVAFLRQWLVGIFSDFCPGYSVEVHRDAKYESLDSLQFGPTTGHETVTSFAISYHAVDDQGRCSLVSISANTPAAGEILAENGRALCDALQSAHAQTILLTLDTPCRIVELMAKYIAGQLPADEVSYSWSNRG